MRTKLILQQQFLAKLAREITIKMRGRRNSQTISLVKALKLKSASIRKEIAVTIQNLPTVALLACPADCGPVTTVYEFERATALIRRAREFFLLARKAIAERNKVETKPRPCDAACFARVKERKARDRAELRYAQNLSRETITTIRATPRIVN